jgi:hypothetical protein
MTIFFIVLISFPGRFIRPPEIRFRAQAVRRLWCNLGVSEKKCGVLIKIKMWNP